MNSLIQQFSYLNPSRHFPRSSNLKSFQTASSLSQSSSTDEDLDSEIETTKVEVKEDSSHDKQSVWSECDPATGICYRRKAPTNPVSMPKNGSDTQMSELQESCGNSPPRLSNSPLVGPSSSFPSATSSFQFFPPTFLASKSVPSSPPFGGSKEY